MNSKVLYLIFNIFRPWIVQFTALLIVFCGVSLIAWSFRRKRTNYNSNNLNALMVAAAHDMVMEEE
jgi:hypothetical protein